MENSLSINDLIRKVSKYNKEGVKDITRAYNYAYEKHKNQKRQSGEPYIIHPLNVAYILADLHADTDTICAGLLHDTLEDTTATKEELIIMFNEDVYNLVNGVTKISKLNFDTKKEQNDFNTRKMISSITEDIRIIIIKLADRLHNMRTLEFKSKEKQIENAKETLEVFVPLAHLIGTYNIKEELEDLSFYYLNKDMYDKIKDERENLIETSYPRIEIMKDNISNNLLKEDLSAKLSLYTKNIYGIYKRLETHENLLDIHDIFAIKILLQEVLDCYKALGVVNNTYHPVNSLFKDYICNPKTNKYQAIHTTLFTGESFLVQARIRTYNMEQVALNGIAEYWHIKGNDARDEMQETIRKKYQFYSSLEELNTTIISDAKFFKEVKKEILSDKVHVFDCNGTLIELPASATPIDFAIRLYGPEIYDITSCIVNNKVVPFNYELKDNDIIRIERNINNKENLTNYIHTNYAKRLLLNKN